MFVCCQFVIAVMQTFLVAILRIMYLCSILTETKILFYLLSEYISYLLTEYKIECMSAVMHVRCMKEGLSVLKQIHDYIGKQVNLSIVCII